MDNPDNWFNCAVCTNKTQFSYLKAQLCRSCAAFYRRAIIENLQYECLKDHRCKSMSDRSFCRLCRFNKCKELGATMGQRDKKRLESKNDPKDKQQEPGTSKALASFSAPFKQSKLADLVHGYDSFLLNQKFLALCANPEIERSNNKMIETNARHQLIEIENSSLPLMLSMFNNYYRFFMGVPMDKQVEIAAQVSFALLNFHRTYLTSQYFPEPEDYSRIMLSSVQYMEIYFECCVQVYWLALKLRQDCRSVHTNDYLKEMLNEGKYDDYNSKIMPLAMKQGKGLVTSFRDFRLLKLQKRDVVCIMFMSVFKHIEYSGKMTEDMRRYQDDLFKEWYDEIKEECGLDNAAERFRKIIEYYITCSNMYEEQKNLNIEICLQNFYKDSTPLCIDYNACLRHLNKDNNRESTTRSNPTNMERPEPPVNESDFNLNLTGLY